MISNLRIDLVVWGGIALLLAVVVLAGVRWLRDEQPLTAEDAATVTWARALNAEHAGVTGTVIGAPAAWDRCSDPPEVSCSDAGCPVHGADDLLDALTAAFLMDREDVPRPVDDGHFPEYARETAPAGARGNAVGPGHRTRIRATSLVASALTSSYVKRVTRIRRSATRATAALFTRHRKPGTALVPFAMPDEMRRTAALLARADSILAGAA